MEIFNNLTKSSNIDSLSINHQNFNQKNKSIFGKNNSLSNLSKISSIIYILINVQIIFGCFVFSLNIDNKFDSLNAYNKAIECNIDNCEICKTKTTCKTCVTNYYVKGGKCYSCPSNCKSKKTDNCLCETCYDGTYLDSNYFCSSCPDNCAKCNDSNTCTQCNDGYFILNNKCSQCNTNCLKCEASRNHCTACESTKFLFEDENYCYDCPNNCKQKGSSDCRCTKCNEGYELNKGQCNACSVENCTSYNEDTCKCNTCINGYYADETTNTCLPCNKNCTICSKVDVCSSCKDGYYIKDNICPECNKNCLTCETSDDHCTSCNDNQYLYEDENEHKCYDCPNNCKRKSDDCRCKNCWKEYKLEKGQCLTCSIDKCTSYNDDTCICNSCKSGYYVNADSNTCEPCDKTKCKECGESATKCKECADNYFLDNYQCLECTECNETQGNTCKCKSCREGYYLYNQNQCFKCNSPCKECQNDANECTSCGDGYYLAQHKCINCYPTCKECFGSSTDAENQRCISCISLILHNNNCINNCPNGYYEEDRECKECNILCKTTGTNCNDCTSCKDGYFLIPSQYKCEQCDTNCQTCSSGKTDESENCLSCKLDSENKYLVNAEGFAKNCVNKCPGGTILDKNNITCILPKNSDDDNNNKSSNALVIALSLIGVVIFLGCVGFIIHCLLKRRKKMKMNNNKADDKLIDEINKDLHLYTSFT